MENIRYSFKEIVALIFRFSGIPFLIREVFCKNKATIVFYHNPKPQVLIDHIKYLSQRYHFISLDHLVRALQSKDWSTIPPKSLVITIDDGYKENYHLLEIFKLYNVRPTLYLCSHIINTNRRFWFSAGYPGFKRLKQSANEKRLKSLKDEAGFDPLKEYDDRQALNLQEMKELQPFADFESHSKFHPILTTCPDDECLEEIQGSKSALEEMLEKNIFHFCYPNGDYSEREKALAEKSGYLSARTIDIGWVDVLSDPYSLKAMGVEDDVSVNILAAQICGFFGYLRYALRGSFAGKKPSSL